MIPEFLESCPCNTCLMPFCRLPKWFRFPLNTSSFNENYWCFDNIHIKTCQRIDLGKAQPKFIAAEPVRALPSCLATLTLTDVWNKCMYLQYNSYTTGHSQYTVYYKIVNYEGMYLQYNSYTTKPLNTFIFYYINEGKVKRPTFTDLIFYHLFVWKKIHNFE